MADQNELKLPTLRETYLSGADSPYTLKPLTPLPQGATPGQAGIAIFVPVGTAYYRMLIYVGSELESTVVKLPNVNNIVIMDLPYGFYTPWDQIDQALLTGPGDGDPSKGGPKPH